MNEHKIMRTRTLRPLIFFACLLFASALRAQTLNDVMKYLDNEQYEKAQSALKTLIASAPNNGDNYFWLGETYFKSDDMDSARTMYDMGLKKNPGNALCMVGMGKVLWFEGKNDEAKKMFYNAGVVIADKTSKLTNQQKAMICLKIAEAYITAPNKDLNEAMNQINKAAMFDQKNILVHIYMGDALYEKTPGNATDAITEYKKARDQDKTSPMPPFKIGVLYFQAKNPDASLTELDNALKVDSMFAPAWRMKGEVFYSQGKLDQAIAAYQRYISINKGSCNARVRYAAFLYLSKKFQECIDLCKQLEKENCTGNSLIYRLMGYSYLELGNSTEGLTVMDTYFKKRSPETTIFQDYETYGKLLVKAGKDSVAVEFYKKALGKDSTKCDLWNEIGLIYKKKKNWAGMADAFMHKVKCSKKVSETDYFYLGQAYYFNGQYAKADTAFMKYCDIRKDIYYGYMWRGRANAALDSTNKTWQANPYYAMAILKSKPEDPKKDLEECYFYMGLYYYKSAKDYASAKCCFQKVVEFKINSDSKDKETRYNIAKNTLDLPELKNATAAPECVKQPPQ